MTSGQLARTLVLPYETLRTVYEGSSEVRLYKNEITGANYVGKCVAVRGLEGTVPVVEAQLLQAIRHANIVPVWDVARVREEPAGFFDAIEMTMPFYASGSLFDALDRGERFSVGDSRRLIAGALMGLAELHEVHHVLHRDVKSSNLFLDDRGRLLIGDLSIAIQMGTGGKSPMKCS